MSYRFGRGSMGNFDRVDPRLIVIASGAILITPVDFMVFDGARSLQEQRKNVADGVSWTMNSKHVIDFDVPGQTAQAIDCVPWVEGQLRWEDGEGNPMIDEFKYIAQAMKKVARWHNIPLKWGANKIYGGDWTKYNDMAHFYIP